MKYEFFGLKAKPLPSPLCVHAGAWGPVNKLEYRYFVRFRSGRAQAARLQKMYNVWVLVGKFRARSAEIAKLQIFSKTIHGHHVLQSQ